MWKKIKDSQYFIDFTDFNLYITDFITIWFKRFNNESFLACLKESNFGLDSIDETELIADGKRMLLNPADLKDASIKIEGKMLQVSISVIYGCPLLLDLNLDEGSKELFFQKVTQQLLKTINDLRMSQKELRCLLQKKDKEIEEYKCEGGEIALRHLKTIPFNDESHMSKYTLYEVNFGSSDIPENLLSKAVKIETIGFIKKKSTKEPEEPAVIVKSEPAVDIKRETIKTEPPSESQNAQNYNISPKKKQKRKLNL